MLNVLAPPFQMNHQLGTLYFLDCLRAVHRNTHLHTCEVMEMLQPGNITLKNAFVLLTHNDPCKNLYDKDIKLLEIIKIKLIFWFYDGPRDDPQQWTNTTGLSVTERKSQTEITSPVLKLMMLCRGSRIFSYVPKAHPKPLEKPRPEKALRIFLRLPKDHLVSQASPHATMNMLRKHLDRTCSSAVKEIQQVPSGLAIWPKNGLDLHLLSECREAMEGLKQGAETVIEQSGPILPCKTCLTNQAEPTNPPPLSHFRDIRVQVYGANRIYVRNRPTE